MSDSLRTYGLQHARLPCPSVTPGACSNSCLSSHWCHPTISPSAAPFSPLPLIFPSIKVFSNESVLCIRKADSSHGPQPCLTQWNCEPCCVGPPKTDGWWWRVLTKCGPLEKGMANDFSIPALRISWTVWRENGGSAESRDNIDERAGGGGHIDQRVQTHL